MKSVLMKCGCRAQGTDSRGNPVCITHFGLKGGAVQVAEIPVLTGRQARCCYCKKITNSSLDLPFFEYKPNEKYDGYYSGCRGWD